MVRVEGTPAWPLKPGLYNGRYQLIFRGGLHIFTLRKRGKVMRRRRSNSFYKCQLALIGYLSVSAVLIASTANAYDTTACGTAALAAQVAALDAQFNRTRDCSLIPKIMALSDRHLAVGRANCGAAWVHFKTHAQVEGGLRARCRHIETASSHQDAPKQNSAETQPSPVKTTKLQQAAGPTMDANSLRAQQGNCSDISGVAGGPAPSNCNQSNGVPQNLQAQINQAKANPPPNSQAGPNSNSPVDAAMQLAIQKLREAEAALRAAGKLAEAASTAEQALALENVAQKQTAACPALGPASYWQGTDNEEYCANANCVERGSALYGMVCFPDPPPNYRHLPPRAEWGKICQEALAQLRPRAPNEEWLADQMARGDVPCDVDGTPLTLRKRLQRTLGR
jgi:hypothetical protein